MSEIRAVQQGWRRLWQRRLRKFAWKKKSFSFEVKSVWNLKLPGYWDMCPRTNGKSMRWQPIDEHVHLDKLILVCWWPLVENIYWRIEKCYCEGRPSLQHSQLNPINNFQLFPKIFGETNKLPINCYLILPDRNHARPHPPSHRLWKRRKIWDYFLLTIKTFCHNKF